MHYGQITNTGIFKQYDYGSDAKNIEHYGSAIVPLIIPEMIEKVPIALMIGQHDDLGDPTDEQHIMKRLHTLAWHKIYPDMDHYSFSIGKDDAWIDDAI